MMVHSLKTLTLFVAGGMLATAAQAQTVVNTKANFSGAVGGSSVNYTNTDSLAGNDEVRWGLPNPGSGLNFNTSASQVVVPNVQFTLGNLVYRNQPINSGTAASSVLLALTPQFQVGANTYNPVFNFTITIDETPNSTPCAYPSTTPCADRISINPTTGQAVAGTNYIFYIDGFLNSSNQTQSFFIAQENANTTARIVGHIAAVPETATWAMMIVGFGAVGGAMRRRQRVRGTFATA